MSVGRFSGCVGSGFSSLSWGGIGVSGGRGNVKSLIGSGVGLFLVGFGLFLLIVVPFLCYFSRYVIINVAMV